MKLYRRAVQFLVLFLVIFTAFFSMYGFIKKEGELEEVESPLLKAGFSAMDAVAGRFFDTLNEYLEASLMIHGSTWSFKLKGLVITDPLAAISAVLSGKIIYLPLLTAIAIPVAFTLLFGRAFCGWMCPMNTLLEAFDWLGRRIQGRDVKFDYGTKYYLLGIGLALSFAGIPVFHWIYPPIILAQEIFSFVFYLSLGFGALLLLGIVLFEFFVSRRAWCRYFCPGGALFSIIASRGFLRITAKKEECKPMVEANPHFKACFECRKNCMLGFDPINKRSRGECNMCGECISACPRDAVKYSFGLPSWMRRVLRGDAG